MKRVFILGAGSSISHSKGLFPAIDEFFKIARNENSGIDLKGEYWEIVDYIKVHTGIDLFEKPSSFDIEAFFTRLEIELERTSAPALFEIRELLLRFIQQVLLGLSFKLKSKDGDYQKFHSEITDDDTIITFNWDLLLDNVLGRVNILQGRYEEEVKYIGAPKRHYEKFINNLSPFSEDSWNHITISPPYKDWKLSNKFYLKMHGSIDWFYCSNNQCRAYLKAFPIIEPDKPHFCSECHESLKCLIIPPVLNKSYRQYPLIRRIWNVAAKEMSIAEEIVIWGYSLPPTDFYASWLLSQARQAPLTRLSIINPNVIKGKKKITKDFQFVKRFYDVFRNKLPATSVRLYENYLDYEDNKQVFSKYKISQ